MKHLFYKSIRFIEMKSKLRFFNGRVYRVKFFADSGKKILEDRNLLEPYKKLIEQYAVKGSCEKAFENLELFTEMIYRLSLHERKKIRILDTGSRAGLFPFFCQTYGHEAVASDLKEVVELSPTKEILSLLNVNAIPLKIEPFVQLPNIDKPFDLITGFRTRFHSRYAFETGLPNDVHWGKKEWTFFLADISKNYLSPQGQIYLVLNRLQDRTRRDKYPVELRKFFHELGGQQRYNELIFNNSILSKRI